MEPQIQYATTADGVSIGYWTLGEGAPFIQMPLIPFSHLQLEWQIPEYRRWFEHLAKKRRLIRYDCRGAGLSDREVADYSLDAFTQDIESVRVRLGLERFDLLGGLNAGPVAIAYAARHPEHVARLILWCTYDRPADFFRPEIQAAQKLIDIDWELYTETMAHSLVVGWAAEGDLAHRIAGYLRECLTWETAKRVVWLLSQFDVSALVPLVQAPTLVFHRRQLSFLDVAVARRLVARLPQGRLALVEGASLVPLGESTEAVLDIIDDFLGSGAAPESVPADAGARSGSVTILFTDVAGSTELTRRLGDAQAREVLRTHERIVRDALAAHGGTEVKTMGDGFLASFASATRALECAIAMQRNFTAHNAAAAEAVHVRIGLNAGEPIAEREDLFGTAVQLAARVCAHAAPGQILVSNVVRELAAGKGFVFTDRGGAHLRGFDEPVQLFEVAWQT